MTVSSIDKSNDKYVSDVHHVGVSYNGNYYSVIFGRYVNGGFFSIPNWGLGGELATYDDVFWNTESLNYTIKNKKAAKQIALAISEYGECKGNEN